MTFSLRRKRPTIHRAVPGRLGRKITSTLFAWCVLAAGVQAQTVPIPELPRPNVITPTYTPAQLPTPQVITPNYVPAAKAPSGVMSAAAQLPPVLPQPLMPRLPDFVDDTLSLIAATDLPGPQRLFRRESEPDFFERIAQDKKKAGGKALFPEEPIISKEPFRVREFPHRLREVEPSYVCHRRLLFEQPNFERAGYDFGILQPGICVGVFYYDMLLLPYHVWSDLQDRTECSVGKCLPGDQAPLLLPREKFSVTGLLGQSATMIGLGLLFP